MSEEELTPDIDEALVDALARKADKDPRLVRLEMAVAEAHEAGYDFEVLDGNVVPPRANIERASIDFGDRHFAVGIVSDTHGGSRFEQRTALHRFYEYAEPSVDAFIHLGDITQGPDNMHNGMELEVHAHGADAQVAYVAEDYPFSQKSTYVLGGNHDASHLKNSKTNVIRRICDLRPDMVRMGQDAAYINLGGLQAFGIHPAGGGSYAKSYRGQKIAETVEDEVGLLLIGHYHNQAQYWRKRTLIKQLMCFQGKYAWLAAKALDPEIGGEILELWLTKDGRIARMRQEVIRFDEAYRDWNHEASAKAAETWRVEHHDDDVISAGADL